MKEPYRSYAGLCVYPDINVSLKSLKRVNMQIIFSGLSFKGIIMTVEWNMARKM